MTPHCNCVYKWFIRFCNQRSSLVQSGADLSIHSVGLADISHKPGFMGQGAWGKPWVSWAGKCSSSEWSWLNKRIKKTSFLCLYFYHEHPKRRNWNWITQGISALTNWRESVSDSSRCSVPVKATCFPQICHSLSRRTLRMKMPSALLWTVSSLREMRSVKTNLLWCSECWDLEHSAALKMFCTETLFTKRA